MGYPTDDDLRAAHERPAPPSYKPPSDTQITRPNWDLWFLRQAFVVAQRGSCPRKQVGAILVRDRDKRVISGGYNGAPSGMPDCLEVGCELRDIGGKPSCVRTIHAESNALDLGGPLSEPHTMYCTVIPCRNCALRIIQHRRIHRVVYHEYYDSQNTKDVTALFAATDEDTMRSIRAKYGEAAYHTPRVELVQLNVPIDQVLPLYG